MILFVQILCIVLAVLLVILVILQHVEVLQELQAKLQGQYTEFVQIKSFLKKSPKNHYKYLKILFHSMKLHLLKPHQYLFVEKNF